LLGRCGSTGIEIQGSDLFGTRRKAADEALWVVFVELLVIGGYLNPKCGDHR
jgi:hypothetical protein